MAMPYQLPTYTVDMVRALPHDGQRYELLDGLLLVTPAPGSLHQVVLNTLNVALWQALVPSNHAYVVSPGELEIGSKNLLDPDILVYPSSYAPGTPWRRIREWWLAVEVLSRASRVYDRHYKVGAYLAFGVREVWLVDPIDRQILVWDQTGRAAERHIGRFTWRPAEHMPQVVIACRDLFTPN